MTLASRWFFGKVDVQEIVSYSKVPQDLTTMFAYDHALLKARLKNVKVVHFIPDLTQINGEQRLGLIATFSEEVDNAYTPASIVLYSSVASKQATEQFRTVKEVARSFDISTKLGHLLADEGKDITGYVGGLHTLMVDDLGMQERISGDLHVNNRGFEKSCYAVFGKPKANCPSALQCLYLIHYILCPWKKWKDILANYIPADMTNTRPPESLINRWYTVVLAGKWTMEKITYLIRLGMYTIISPHRESSFVSAFC